MYKKTNHISFEAKKYQNNSLILGIFISLLLKRKKVYKILTEAFQNTHVC